MIINVDVAAWSLILAVAFTLMLAVIIHEGTECEDCGHYESAHGRKGCTGEDTMGGYIKPCRCHNYRRAKP